MAAMVLLLECISVLIGDFVIVLLCRQIVSGTLSSSGHDVMMCGGMRCISYFSCPEYYIKMHFLNMHF